MGWFRLSDLLYRNGAYVEAEGGVKRVSSGLQTRFGSAQRRTFIYFVNPLMGTGHYLVHVFR